MQVLRSLFQLITAFIGGSLLCAGAAFLLGLALGPPAEALLYLRFKRAVVGPADPAFLYVAILLAAGAFFIGLIVCRLARVFKDITASGSVGVSLGAMIGWAVFGNRSGNGLAVSVYLEGAAGVGAWAEGPTLVVMLLAIPLLLAYPIMLWNSRRKPRIARPGQFA